MRGNIALCWQYRRDGVCRVKIDAVDGNDPLFKVKTVKRTRWHSIATTISRYRWFCADMARVTT